MNRCLHGAHIPKWITKEKTTLIQKNPSQRNRPQKIQTDDVENINSTNKGSDLLLANKPWIIPSGTERMPQKTQGHRRVTLHRSANPKQEQDQTEKSSYGLVDCKKAYYMVPQSWIINCFKMHKISHEDIKFIEKTMKTWRVELAAEGKSLAEAKIKEVFFKENHYHCY